jgi:hypothetical protein
VITSNLCEILNETVLLFSNNSSFFLGRTLGATKEFPSHYSTFRLLDITFAMRRERYELLFKSTSYSESERNLILSTSAVNPSDLICRM